MFSLVVPLFREEQGIDHTVAAAREALASLSQPCEIILIDDGSDDGTWQAVCRHAAAGGLRGIRLSRNFGKEAAICAGLEAAADAQAAIIMDGDLQHPPALIAQMVEVWRSGQADIVEAVKPRRPREPMVARLGSKVFYRLLRRLSGFDLAGASDFKLLDARVCEAYRRMGERALFFRGMIAWLGFRRVQIPFEVPDRASGRSKWRLGALWQLATTGLTAFSSSALRIVNWLAAIFLLLAVAMGIRALWVYFAGQPGAGITTVILLQLLTGGFVLLGLGIIGEYIARIYEEVKARPRYVVAEKTSDH
ncbi:MAG: glycosyltransferase family 2 protein [Planctomycetaceae bacterium]|nr:glycosyltransferase family 2 protein [Planctomycetaceae bacterium]